VTLHGYLISDRPIKFDDSGMQSDFHSMKEVAEVGVILCEFVLPLWEDKGNGFNIHREGDVMI
jgi:hypothetical protein